MAGYNKKKVSNCFYLLLVLAVLYKWLNQKSDTVVSDIQWATSYDLFTKSSFNVLMAPRNHDEIAASLVRAEQDGASITIRGAGFSFGGQGLPPTDDNKTHYILSTAKLKEVSCVHTTEYEVVIRVGAGVTWKEAVQYANSQCGLEPGQQAIPYSAPTSGDITVSASVAAHTHSATTAGTGGYTHEHISHFTRVTPRNEYKCHVTELLTFNHNVCSAAIGSYGRLGVIDDLTLRLKVIDDHTYVENKVLFKTNDKKILTRNYLERVINKTQYDFGIATIFHGSEGEGYVLGSRYTRCEQKSECSDEFPGFDGPTLYNQLFYAIGHFVGSNIRNIFFKNTFYNGRIGYSNPGTRTFFQDTHVTTRQSLSYLTSLPPLPLVHQAWFIPGDNISALLQFIELVHKTMKEREYLPVQGFFELGDTLRLPSSQIPTHVTYYHGPGHIYTITFAVHSDEDNKIAAQFCREISSRSSGLALPMLLKGIQAPPTVLRNAHSNTIDFVQGHATEEDPAGIMDSMFWRTLSL